MSLTSLSAFEVARKVKAGELKAVEVAEAALAQIRAVDGLPGSLDGGAVSADEEKKVHAFIQVTEKMTLEQAEKVDQAIARGAKMPGFWPACRFRSRIFLRGRHDNNGGFAHALEFPGSLYRDSGTKADRSGGFDPRKGQPG